MEKAVNETTKNKGKKDKHNNEQTNKITSYWSEQKQEAQNLTKTDDDDNIEQNNKVSSIQYSDNKLNESSSMTLAASVSVSISASSLLPSILSESVLNKLQNGAEKLFADKTLNLTNK